MSGLMGWFRRVKGESPARRAGGQPVGRETPPSLVDNKRPT